MFWIPVGHPNSILYYTTLGVKQNLWGNKLLGRGLCSLSAFVVFPVFFRFADLIFVELTAIFKTNFDRGPACLLRVWRSQKLGMFLFVLTQPVQKRTASQSTKIQCRIYLKLSTYTTASTGCVKEKIRYHMETVIKLYIKVCCKID